MVKNHLSRLNAPTSWPIKRKGIKFITRPSSGPHTLRESLPLSLVVTHLLKYARTRKEVKKILNEKKILVNSTPRKDLGYAVGLMDIIAIPTLDEAYRVFYNEKGKFQLHPLPQEERDLKPVQIKDKKIVKQGKIQLNYSDGTNQLITNESYRTRDTLLLSMKDKKITQHFPFTKGARVYITGGTKRGTVGILEDTKGNTIVVKSPKGSFETAKRYAFVIGNIQTLMENI